AGGTQRLPRLTGPEKALEMITTGRHISAKEAHASGLVDQIIDGDLREGAMAFAKKLIADKAPLKKVRDLSDKVTGVSPDLFAAARAQAAKEKRNFIAPQRCIDAVEAACTLPFDEGMKRERELFTELVTSVQSAAQRHIFFAERAAGKIANMPDNVQPIAIKHAAVLGAGTMGGGIAMNFVTAGIPTYLFEVSQEALDRGLKTIRSNYERSARKGRMTAEQVEQAMAMIKPTLTYDDFKDVDF